MDQVTWPDASVGSFLTENYRGTKFDLMNPHDEFSAATATAKVMWAPTFIIDDGRGRELRRWTGWLPPEEFLPELMLPVAMNHLHIRRIDEGAALLAKVVEESPKAPAAAEALHFLGIFEFLAGKRDMAKLRERWNAVREQYPESRFARHSEVIDDAK